MGDVSVQREMTVGGLVRMLQGFDQSWLVVAADEDGSSRLLTEQWVRELVDLPAYDLFADEKANVRAAGGAVVIGGGYWGSE